MNTNQYGFPPPAMRIEMESNLYLVVEDVNRKLDSGNKELIQNVAWATYPHLKKVKPLPNGRVNLSTVNEMIRLQANTMRWRF
jgi:hypothetical protein